MVQDIISAIEGLRSEPDYIKDYIVPIFVAFFSSLLGAGVAYFTIRYQDDIQVGRDRVNAINRWVLIADEIRDNLLAIKRNYVGKLTENPIQRFAAVPSILISASPILVAYDNLSFILPKIGAHSGEVSKWSSVSRIRIMVSNYNLVLSSVSRRNEIDQPVKLRLFNQYPNNGAAYTTITEQEIIDCIGAAEAAISIDLTEMLVALTDDLLIDVNDFLLTFPGYAKKLVGGGKRNKYGRVMTYFNTENELFLKLIVKSPKANYSLIERLFGESGEQIGLRYKTGY